MVNIAYFAAFNRLMPQIMFCKTFINHPLILTPMAKLRKACAYRRTERAYTRKSKYKSKSFVRASPHIKIVRYDMGNLKKDFPVKVQLLASRALQLRHNSLESARLTSNRLLEGALGKSGFHIKLRVYPHHILRENPLASGAGADRMSTGMKMSFGKPIGSAAQVDKDQVIMEVGVEPNNLSLAKKAMQRAKNKFPCSCRIVVQGA